ncbi:TPA: cell wall-active antibiotics response protein [Streptococcus suis]|nr:cell wall-active antibiotics response protein [Streptococcus suis]
MRKVQLFLLLESIVFTLALFDVVASETSRVILIFAVLMTAIWYVTGRKFNSPLLSSVFFLFFLVFALNPYFILGSLFFIVYILINFFSRNEKRSQYTHILLDDEAMEPLRQKNQWWGNQEHSQDHYGFEDINIIRLFGNDVVDLDETVLVGRDNIVIIRKTFGRTKIILPIDVEISLSATTLYGQVGFLGLSRWNLRNERLAVASPGYQESHKRVKVVVNSLYGDVEVVRI